MGRKFVSRYHHRIFVGLIRCLMCICSQVFNGAYNTFINIEQCCLIYFILLESVLSKLQQFDH
jgi:hypothetical protein